MKEKKEKRLCRIESRVLGQCDLPWGHSGMVHSSAGAKFFSDLHATKHKKRQEARRESARRREK